MTSDMPKEHPPRDECREALHTQPLTIVRPVKTYIVQDGLIIKSEKAAKFERGPMGE